MTTEKKRQLIEAGVDFQRSLERFMNNEALYEKFLDRFPQDSNYRQLAQAVAQGDEKQAEIAAHTLKGVAGNLGFTELMGLLDEMVRRLRGGEPCGQLQGLLERVTACYTALCAVLQPDAGAQ